MLLLHGECGRNANFMQENMQLDFLTEHIQDQICFCDLSCYVRTPQNEEVVLGTFNEDPTPSIHAVARMVDVSRSTIQRIIRDNRQHAYHYRHVQNLMSENYPARVNFCTWLLQKCDENPRFVYKVLFTNEPSFSRGGTFNAHNYHIWAKENPHAITVRSFQRRFSVEPFELPAKVTGEIYANFLEEDLPEPLDNVLLAQIINMWF
ncbi:hypothetical protein BDFB_013122 [Asbolus verrucosus]|uniref:Uncharacterized protein n=1 Tax=Asbolus verrucosus TaxID=1661398 RepID=A0A482W583_ASBVE|nr:hypothetical protein BDFB_013122 [Asbolus verrucosus]